MHDAVAIVACAFTTHTQIEHFVDLQGLSLCKHIFEDGTWPTFFSITLTTYTVTYGLPIIHSTS